MLNSLLVNVADKSRTVPIEEAALYALLGFAVVFLGIVFLIGIIWLVGKGMGKVNMLQGKAKEPKAKATTAQTSAQTKPVVGEEEISEETIVILTAAIMAYYQETNPKCEFTVKRIKRI